VPEPTEALSPTEPTSTPATSGPTPAVPRALRLGVAGPVGTGKSSLIALLCRELGHRLSVAVVTNDIYTDEDARFLRSAGVLDPERIRAVETGACPHTAIRDDVSQNLLAVEDLEHDFAPVDLVLVESGGDNLTATFSPALVDAQFFVLDVAGGGDVARKGGPGIARADVLVVNKTDLAPHVGVDVAAMVQDAGRARAGGRVIALSRTDPGSVAELREWVLATLARFRSGGLVPVDPGPMAPHTHAADEHSHAEGEHEHSHADGEHEHEHSHADGDHEHSHGHGDREARHSAAAGGEARGEPSGR
jgi:urease accessory protein